MTPKPDAEPLRPGLAAAIESETERAAKRIVPWVVSAGLHTVLIAVGFLVTWTVVSLSEEEPPIRVTADFQNLHFDPLVQLESGLTSLEDTARPEAAAVQAIASPGGARSDFPADLHQLAADAVQPAPMAGFTPGASAGSATFVGLTTTNARRIVYVIDASGSMIRTFPIVIQELARSLDGLAPPQEFGLLFFQRNEAVVVPPAGRLVPAEVRPKLDALAWIDGNVVPAGRSNPLAAIEKALQLRPDVIFVLSENITGSGQFEIDQQDLLALLDRLNPLDAATGLRATRINCVQFLYPDPLDTLKKIAARHGGPGGYKFLDAAELGIAAP